MLTVQLQMRLPPSPIASSSSDGETEEDWKTPQKEKKRRKKKKTSSMLDYLHKERRYPDQVGDCIDSIPLPRTWLAHRSNE